MFCRRKGMRLAPSHIESQWHAGYASWGTATDDDEAADHRSCNGGPKIAGQDRRSIATTASTTLTDMALPIIASNNLIGTSGGHWGRCGLMC